MCRENQLAFNKYVGLLNDFFSKLDNNNGMIDSLEIVLNAANEATYGRALVGGIQWFIDSLKMMNKNYFDGGDGKYNYLNFLDKLEFLGKVICGSKIEEGWCE